MKRLLKLFALLPLALAACPLPLTLTDVDSALAEVAPVISIASPAENAPPLGPAVRVAGGQGWALAVGGDGALR